MIAIWVCGWSGKDQSVTSSPFHTVHTWRLLFDLQLLFAELVTVCNSASQAHLRPRSSCSENSTVPDCNKPVCSVYSSPKVDFHDKVLETLFSAHLCADFPYLPSLHHPSVVTTGCSQQSLHLTIIVFFFFFQGTVLPILVSLSLCYEKNYFCFNIKNEILFMITLSWLDFFFKPWKSMDSDEVHQNMGTIWIVYPGLIQ